ncbi:MAG: 8-amino-7-oxononanoate synthase [Candidatus Omnitrophica bacterium]|nr:8-amino-7-oxononanoate synthase [Candidatus Omnitrophota bacterium]
MPKWPPIWRCGSCRTGAAGSPARFFTWTAVGSDPFGLAAALDERRAAGLYRSVRRVEGASSPHLAIDGRDYLNLASNNYLGLTTHPRVVGAAADALRQYGTGAGASRLIAGHLAIHEQLETALAAFKQTEAALVFPTGYMANLGAITALVGPGDLVIADRLAHASLIDACRLSRATFRVYPHGDVERLRALLARRRGARRTLVVTDSVFSMDGDLAPLPALWDVCRAHDAWLLVDDAHGAGVLGATGRGALEHVGMAPTDGVIQMGTLSKAFGSLGGFIAGSTTLIEYLRNTARAFIYTTALPPPAAAAALAAIRVVQEEPALRQALWARQAQWTDGLTRLGLPLVSNATPIVPILLGDTARTMAVAQALQHAGIYAPGIRPPTVPEGAARIRTTVMATHAAEELDEALVKIAALVHRGEL